MLLSCLLSLLALCSRLHTKSMAKKGYNTKLVRLASWIILEGGYTQTQGHRKVRQKLIPGCIWSSLASWQPKALPLQKRRDKKSSCVGGYVAGKLFSSLLVNRDPGCQILSVVVKLNLIFQEHDRWWYQMRLWTPSTCTQVWHTQGLESSQLLFAASSSPLSTKCLQASQWHCLHSPAPVAEER